MIWRTLKAVLALLFLAGLGLVAWIAFDPAPDRGGGPPARPRPAVEWPAAPADCGAHPAFAQAAALNAISLTSAAWSVFGRPETGWEIYAPLTAQEIGSVCPPDTPGFAEALAAWQGSDHPSGAGVMDEATLQRLRTLWLSRRPFVAATAHGFCPPPATPDQLASTGPDEAFGGKPIQLRPGALAAYRELLAAARAESPEIGRDRRLLTIVSGYRDPDIVPQPCDLLADCRSITRARCSAHRTGVAMDLYLGAAPGYGPAAADDANRLYQSTTPAYRWMIANASRFGFYNYPFEPWHWEWTGEGP